MQSKSKPVSCAYVKIVEKFTLEEIKNSIGMAEDPDDFDIMQKDIEKIIDRSKNKNIQKRHNHIPISKRG